MTQPAERDAVQFTRESATRIANVVRTVELGVPKLSPLVFDRVVRDGGGGGAIRLCTFTGQWMVNDGKIVRFATDTNATANVINQLFSIGDACTTQRAYVSVVRDPAQAAGVRYHLINVQHFETPIVTNILLGTAAIEFTKKLAWVPYPAVTSSQYITISTATSC